MITPVEADGTVNKSDFAAHLGVSAARISQYIAEGKLSADALVGTGRAARIRLDVAMCAQLLRAARSQPVAGQKRQSAA